MRALRDARAQCAERAVHRFHPAPFATVRRSALGDVNDAFPLPFRLRVKLLFGRTDVTVGRAVNVTSDVTVDESVDVVADVIVALTVDEDGHVTADVTVDVTADGITLARADAPWRRDRSRGSSSAAVML